MKLEPFLSLSGKVTSQNGVTACGFQAGSTGTSLYLLGGEFSLGRGRYLIFEILFIFEYFRNNPIPNCTYWMKLTL